MAGKNLSPRQQMIGLMYLVLLAMLAMNASKDLLNAFIFLDDGIKVTNENLESGNKTVFDKIASSAALGSEKALSALKNAKEIQSKSNELMETLQTYKNEIVALGGGVDEETGIPLGKDNQDVGAEFMLVKKNGEVLKEKINQYKDQLVAFVDPKDSSIINSVSQILATPEYVDYENNKASWESGISEHLPLVAVTANLSNIETYVQNAATQILNYLYEGIALDTYKVNKILATSVSDKSYILQGEQYNANVFLAAADTTQEPLILIGEYDTALYQASGKVKFLGAVDSLPVSGGIGNYQIKADKVGSHTWGGIMKVPHPNPKRKGEYLMYPFENSYTVAAPTAVISSEQLNIMYLGLKNEINVSAPGISSDKLVVRASNGCRVSKKSDGKYVFTPTRTGKVSIQVYVEEDGNTKQISSQSWNSKRLPKPEIRFINKFFEGRMAKNRFKIPNNEKFTAAYSPDFPISATVDIRSCDVEIVSKGSIAPYKLSRGIFTPQLKRAIKSLRSNDKVIVTMKIKDKSGISHSITQSCKIK